MTSAALAGSTGLVGSHILSTLLAHPSISTVHAFARKPLPQQQQQQGEQQSSATATTTTPGAAEPQGEAAAPPSSSSSTKLRPIISSDTSTWASSFPSNVPLYLTALGTTRAAAGSFEAQRAIDVDLNHALAKAAKERNDANADNSTIVLVSSAGASATSRLPYPKMKGEIEDAVTALGFDHTVILRPGLIVGDRSETRAAEGVLRNVAKAAGAVSGGLLKNFWAQDADVIARAAVVAGLMCVEGKRPAGAAGTAGESGDGGKKKDVWIVDQKEILKLGKAEIGKAEAK